MMIDLTKRPKSLSEIPIRVGQTNQLWSDGLAEFLDNFYTSNPSDQQSMIDQPPDLFDDKADAYLAAVAEYLASKYELNIPDWVHDESRFLKRAYFPVDLESVKPILIKESPLAFRRRMIFVEERPLRRASMFQN